MAKLPERRSFARQVAARQPKVLVDLGCADGLWLDLLDQEVSTDCTFIGVDSDEAALTAARARSSRWSRTTEFIALDIEAQAAAIPPADLTLAFNVFPYVRDLDLFLATLAARRPRGAIAVRQYDGGLLRFGPMAHDERLVVDNALSSALSTSEAFGHYDLDRSFEALMRSPYKRRDLRFELFQRFAPYDAVAVKYIADTIRWTSALTSEAARPTLDRALRDLSTLPSYFVGTDLVGFLS